MNFPPPSRFRSVDDLIRPCGKMSRKSAEQIRQAERSALRPRHRIHKSRQKNERAKIKQI
jgi:hypothetical protein